MNCSLTMQNVLKNSNSRIQKIIIALQTEALEYGFIMVLCGENF